MRHARKPWLTQRLMCLLIFIGIMIMMAPLLYIGQYNHMCADDYWYGLQPHLAWQNTHSIFKVLVYAYGNIGYFWNTWQGTYSSIFFFSLPPSLFGEQYYAIVPYMMIGMIYFSTFVLAYVFLRKILKVRLSSFMMIAGVTAFMQSEFLYSAASALYWYNGSVHYVFMQGFLYLALACAGVLFYRCLNSGFTNARAGIGSVFSAILTAALGFIAAGANFSTSLLIIEFFTLLMGCAIWMQVRHRKPTLLFILPYLCTVAGFGLNVLAPGNSIRQTSFQGMGITQSILVSFSCSIKQAASWIDVFVLFCMVLLLPVFLRMLSKITFKFRFPLVVLVGSYCLYASMFAPGFYALGAEPLARNQNICKMFLLILLIANEIYCVGWLLQKTEKMKQWIPTHGKNVALWVGTLCVAAAISVAVFLNLNEQSRKDHFVTYGAWELIYTGIGELYRLEYLTNLNAIVNSSENIVYIEPYTVFAYPLWVNGEAPGSSWYGKQGIFFKEE